MDHFDEALSNVEDLFKDIGKYLNTLEKKIDKWNLRKYDEDVEDLKEE